MVKPVTTKRASRIDWFVPFCFTLGVVLLCLAYYLKDDDQLITGVTGGVLILTATFKALGTTREVVRDGVETVGAAILFVLVVLSPFALAFVIKTYATFFDK